MFCERQKKGIIFSVSGIPPHVDTVEAFEDGIMSLSLGSQVSLLSIAYFTHRVIENKTDTFKLLKLNIGY